MNLGNFIFDVIPKILHLFIKFYLQIFCLIVIKNVDNFMDGPMPIIGEPHSAITTREY